MNRHVNPSSIVAKHYLKNRIGNNTEPPVRLIKATTIFIGICGYVQVGYQCKLNGAEEPSFILSCVIAINATWIVFDRTEIENFILYMNHLINETENDLPVYDDDFMGKFFVDKHGDEMVITYCNYKDQSEYSLNIPSKNIIENLLAVSDTISRHMNAKFVLAQQFEEELLYNLNEAAKKCINSPEEIKALISHDQFVTEIACNHFSLFCQYWQFKKQHE